MIITNYAVGCRSFSQSRSTETTKLCCFPADDDQFSKLKAVFLATGRGCRQDLPLVEVDKPTVSAAASPERWGIQDFGWDCISSSNFSSQIWSRQCCFLCLRYWWSTGLKELFGGEPLPELPPLHGHGGCQQRHQQVEEESDPGDVDWTRGWIWNLMNLSLKPASDFNRRVTLWQSTM